MKMKRILSAALASLLLLASCANPGGNPETDGENNGGETADGTNVAENSASVTFPLAAAAKEPEGMAADAALTDAVAGFSEKFYKEAAKSASLSCSPFCRALCTALMKAVLRPEKE